jgi:hypothetical protein
MSDPRLDLPAIPASAGPLKPALDQMRQAIQTYLGFRGNELDMGVTWRQLLDRGFAIRETYPGGTGGPIIPNPGTGNGGDEDDEPDLTPPPTPTGLAVTAGITTLIIEWAPALYLQGHGHGQTNIYGATWPFDDPTPPTFAEAVQIAVAPNALTIYAHATQPNTRWCIWIKWQSRDGVESVSPAGGTNGVQATTGQDVALLLDVLTGQITQSQLFADLSDRIDLIDADASVPGSVAARIQEVQDQVNTLLDTPAYDNATAYAIDDVVSYDGKLYRAIAATTGNLPTNTTYWQLIGNYDSLAGVVAGQSLTLSDHEARILDTEDGIVAEAVARDALAAQIRGSYSGTDINALTTGLIYSERVARASADSAIASSVTALSATVTNNLATVNAAILAEQTARVNADAAEATARQAVNARLNTGGDVAVSIASVTTTANAKSATFVQGTAPTATRVNDTWIDTANGRVLRRWNGTAWELADDQRIETSVSTITRLQSQVQSGEFDFEPIVNWTFDTAGALEGWTRRGIGGDNVTSVGGNLVYTQGTDPIGYVRRDFAVSERYLGSTRPLIRVVSGAAPTSISLAYYWNNFANNDSKTVNLPTGAVVGTWYTVEVDMGDEPNYLTNTIERIFISVVPNSIRSIEYDWIALGRRGTGISSIAFQQEASTRAAADGSLFAQYTVKIDANGYVSGFGLASTAVNATPFSEFIVRADSFSVASPSGPGIAPIVPFVVRTTPGTINGVAVPVGVYMDAAFILRGTITGAQIGNAVIDDAKIASLSAAKLTVGDGTVGGNLRSSNYVAGTSGWIVRPDGFAEFSNAVVRGTIFATAGQIGGNTINATGMQSPNYAAGSVGWRINSSGAVEFSSATIRGNIKGGAFTGYAWPASGTGFYLGPEGLLLGNANTGRYFQVEADGDIFAPGFTISGGAATFSGALAAASGSFVGALNAATGTFAGSLTASAVNAVNTINLAGDAVTVPAATLLASNTLYGSTELVLCQVSLDTQGSRLFIISEFTSTAAAGGFSEVRLRVNGTVIRQWGVASDSSFTRNVAVGTGFVASPGTGTITVQLTARETAAGSATAIGGACSLFALGVKR